MSVYGTSTVKRSRSTKADIETLDRTILDVAAEEQPLTIRACFYRVMSRGAVPKTENGYRQVQRRVLTLRRNGRMSRWWIVDGTRYRRRPSTWTSLPEALDHHARAYRRDLWDQQPVYVEVWSEKDAISGTVSPITQELDVPLMVSRGYSSETFLWEAAQEIKQIGKPTVIYQLGDHDPSGVDAWRQIKERFAEFAPTIDFRFERVAVTPAQIEEYSLPTRPTKQSDSRSRGFDGDSVEVDALPSTVLRSLLRDRIESLIDQRQLAIVKAAEQSERNIMRRIAVGGGE